MTDSDRIDKLEAIENAILHRHWFGIMASGKIIARPRKSASTPFHSLRDAIDAAPWPESRRNRNV